jgi:hypothetical protein
VDQVSGVQAGPRVADKAVRAALAEMQRWGIRPSYLLAAVQDALAAAFTAQAEYAEHAENGYRTVANELDAAGLADPESLVGTPFPTYALMADDGYLIAQFWQHPDGSHWCATRFVDGYSQGAVTGQLFELAELVAGWTR